MPRTGGVMSSGGLCVVLLLTACSPPPPCPPEEDRFDPEVDIRDALDVDGPSDDVMDLVCTGGLTVTEWTALAETSPGYTPVFVDCELHTCVGDFEYRTVCTLEATLTAWRDMFCPDCRITYVDYDAPYTTKFVECVP